MEKVTYIHMFDLKNVDINVLTDQINYRQYLHDKVFFDDYYKQLIAKEINHLVKMLNEQHIPIPS